MLNRLKVAREFERVSGKLFPDFSSEFDVARVVWSAIADDPTFAHKVRGVNTTWLIPSWSGRLNDQFSIEQQLEQYRVLGTDGSQIYPDRHQGTTCFLINIGSVHLNYSVGTKAVELDSEPTVFVGDEDVQLHESAQELVNCRRQELEFFAGLEHSRAMRKACGDEPALFLFDGSLIFWHLESKEVEVKNRFLASYLDSLQKLYEERILLAGYISLTKSKELVNLIRVALTEFAHDLGLAQFARDTSGTSIDCMSDAQVVRFFLQPFSRTILFKNHSSITKYYPQHLHPHFFYLHVGSEIARVELPAWIAQSEQSVNIVARMIVNQCVKGDGYPVALAEAHEQAVVKGPDRDFFYHLVRKVGLAYQQRQFFSQKVRNKRVIRI